MNSRISPHRTLRRRHAVAITLAEVLIASLPSLAIAQQQRAIQQPQQYCIRIEAIVRSGSPQSDRAAEFLRDYATRKPGVVVDIRDVKSDPKAEDDARKLLHDFRIKRPGLPVIHACRQLIVGFRDAETTGKRVDDLTVIDAYVRNGCPHCADAKAFFARLGPRYPGFTVRYHEIVTDPQAKNRLLELAQQYNQSATNVPGIHFCGKLLIGYDRDETSGARIEALMREACVECPARRDVSAIPPAVVPVVPGSKTDDQRSAGSPLSAVNAFAFAMAAISMQEPAASTDQSSPERAPPDGRARESPPIESRSNSVENEATDAAPLGEAPLGEAPLGEAPLDEVPLDEVPLGEVPVDELPQDIVHIAPDDEVDSERANIIDLPVFGKINVRQLGLPLFTIAIGLIDGFNPCAMWVLLFLLSILVNLKDRRKILAVAGTFVVISGAAYYAFMAAWLNVFLFVGYLRWAQILLGLLAVIVGTIHVKDFFAFHKGVSLSIPDSAKPKIFDRVRKIVNAENLFAAIIGASVLAVLVNVVELLCTAGLPALYTQILASRDLPPWANYAYLGLYILAYMFDDSLMVAIVVITLGRHKMQERHGRWLKLVSGLVVLLLGLVLLFKPQWLDALNLS